MEERIKQISRYLKTVFTCYWLLAILMVVCGETLDSWTGLYAGDVRSTYQAETATILLAVVCVPVSLKLFSWVLDHKIDAVSLPEALRLYAWWSVVRLFLLFLPVVVGFLTYYLMLSTKGVLCALIALTASLFCIPGENRLRKELRIDKEKEA